MLSADVVVAQLQCFTQREFEHLLGAGRERDVPARCLLTLTDDLFDLRAHGFERDAKALKCLRSDAFALVDQAEQDVLGPDVVVVEHARFFLRKHDHPPGPVGKPLKHGLNSFWCRWGKPTGRLLPTNRSTNNGCPIFPVGFVSCGS